MLLGSYCYEKSPEGSDLKGRRISFQSQFQRFQSMINWLLFGGAYGKTKYGSGSM